MADRLQLDSKSVVIERDGEEVKKSLDQMVLKWLSIYNDTTLTIKSRPPISPFVSSLDSSSANTDISYVVAEACVANIQNFLFSACWEVPESLTSLQLRRNEHCLLS